MKRIIKKLNDTEGIAFFKKEAASIRGIPDIIGCIHGKFFCLEVKRGSSYVSVDKGRAVLQRRFIERIKKLGGFGSFIHPENQEEILKQLIEYGNS